MPKLVNSIMAVAGSVISLGLDSSNAMLSCFGVDGYLGRLALWMLLPPIAVSIIFILCLARLLRSDRSHERTCNLNTLTLDVLPPAVRVLFILYPIVTNTAFEGFSCYTFGDGSSYLMADVSVDCHSDEYKQRIKPVVWAAVIIYAIGLIVLKGVLLWMVRDSILDKSMTPLATAIAFLYRECTRAAQSAQSALSRLLSPAMLSCAVGR
jgi:hypothetical protein